MKKILDPFMGSMVLMGMALAICTTVFADAKVDEQVMVPKTAGVACRVGPNGLHIVCVAPKGSHSVIYFDGVAQPKFDSLLLTTGTAYIPGTPNIPTLTRGDYDGPVTFSPDGIHWAYMAIQDGNYVVVEDGKEVSRAPYNTSVFNSGSSLMFSPAGNHLYYTVFDNIPNNSHYRIVVDGQPGPWSKGVSKVLFSPDGNHYTYTGVADDTTTQWSVIDGKQVPYFGDNVQFTDTGHLLSVYNANGVSLMIADGKPVLKALAINQVWISPKGTLTVAQIQPQANAPQILTVNRQPVPGTTGLSYRGVYFSPDGQHYAALCHTPNGPEFILEDGKKGDEYPSINNSAFTPAFSPDSSKFLYVAQSGQQNFLVTNGDESDGFQDLAPKPIFTPDGKHLAYGFHAFGANKYTVYVDGKALPPTTATPANTFAFSPDGSRYAFATGYGSFDTLFVDGVAVPNIGVSNWQIDNLDTTVTTFNYLFSPDSKHITYPAADANGGSRGLWVDQELVFKTTQKQPDKIVFTPDSQHLFWTIMEPPDTAIPGPGWHERLYVDGKPSIEYVASFFDNYPGTWTMQSNGTLQFYTIADDNIKRYTVTPGADTSITTLLASAASATK